MSSLNETQELHRNQNDTEEFQRSSQYGAAPAVPNKSNLYDSVPPQSQYDKPVAGAKIQTHAYGDVNQMDDYNIGDTDKFESARQSEQQVTHAYGNVPVNPNNRYTPAPSRADRV